MESTKERVAAILHGGIRLRIFMLVILIVLPFAGLLGWVFQQRYEGRRHRALQSELEVARGLAVTFNAYLNGIRKESQTLGHAIRMLSPKEGEKIKELLMVAAGNSASVRNVNWVSPRGIVLFSSAPGFDRTDLSSRSYFRTIVSGQKFAVGNLTESGVIAQRPTVVVATAICDDKENIDGIIVVAIEPTRLDEVTLTQKRSEQQALVLFDSNGTIVYHSLLKSADWRQRNSWLQADTVLQAARQNGHEQSGIQLLPMPEMRKWVSARVPVAATGWVAGAGESAEAAFAEVRHGMINDLLVGSTVSVLALLLAYLLGRNISAPLQRLEEDAVLMAKGELVERRESFAPDEINSLRLSLMTMTYELVARAEKLRESQASLHTVINNVYDGISIHDIEGRIAYVNTRWLDMFRITWKEASGLTISDFSAGTPPLNTIVPLWQDVLSGQTKFFEWRSRRPVDDQAFDVEIFLCPIRYEERDLIMANIRDITERKRVEHELQQARDELEVRVKERTEELSRAFDELKNETEQRIAAVENLRRQEQLLIQQSRLAAMGEMMVNISHQWRQPLNVVGLIAQEVSMAYKLGTLTEEEMETRTAKIMDVIGHMSQTIDDFRNYLNPDKKKSQFTTREVVETVLHLMDGDLKLLNVQTEMMCGEECHIEGFRNEYVQVIMNVMANARDILRERHIAEPRIQIRLFQEKGRSVVTIADNGGGIDPAIIDRIFEPYFTTKGPDKGTGVGLFMSKNIIEKNMAGRLTVRNSADGAEFRIEV